MTVHVKICGLTNLTDARVAIEAGADLLGFILYAKSPRYVTPAQVAAILKELRHNGPERTRQVRAVGVFVNESIDRIQLVLEQTGLDLAQLHGDESVEMLAQLSHCAYKALRPTAMEFALRAATEFSKPVQHEHPLLHVDAYDPSAYGGTGRRADWHIAAGVARSVPGLLLAGGLSPQNVADAVAAVQPWGVDVSSGVEATPGRKNHTAVQDFVTAAKSARFHADP